jgi:uncharacterized protein (AIM24 family)
MPPVEGDLKSQHGQRAGRAPVPTEDFLYHLHRGSDLLMQDRVVEAKEELERALTHQPQDAKSQDLLAGVYFRLGVYPRAIGIWSHLVGAFPKDPTLRVNLGLALFKTGQHEQALDHIHTALRIQPDHERAWGYLGLIHWRRGQLAEARDAFLRGGQATMARRMEESLPGAGSTGGSTPALDDTSALEPSGEVRGDDEAAREEAGIRSAADEAMARFEAEELPLSLAEPEAVAVGAPAAAWQTRAPGEEPVPLVHRRARPLPAAAPPTLASLLTTWTVAVPEGTTLALGAGGELHVEARGNVFCRLEGLVATRGTFRTGMVRRRARGKELEEILGGDNPIMQWYGPVGGIVAPPEGRGFFGVSMEEGDTVFLREEALFAFEETLSTETGRLPLAGEPAVLIQLSGHGTAILCLEGPPKGLPVEDGTEVRVDPSRLIGWTGRLLPGASRGTLPYAATAPPLSFRGEGTVLLR